MSRELTIERCFAICRRVGTAALVAASIIVAPCAVVSARAEPAAPPAPSGPACNAAQFRVVVDVGHTAKSPGARSARGVSEFDFNLRLAKRIELALIDAGFDSTLLLITEGPTAPGLLKRVADTNGLPTDLFISIHHDSVPKHFLEAWEYEGRKLQYSDRFPGHSLFISYENGNVAASLQFAKLLGHQLKARGLQYTPHYTEAFMGPRRRDLLDAEVGVYRFDKLRVLHGTTMAAVLFEAGSIIHRDEELVLATPERQALMSAAVVDAVDRFCALRQPKAATQTARRAQDQRGLQLIRRAGAAERTKPAKR